MTSQTIGRLVPISLEGDRAVQQAALDERRRALEVGVWDDMPLGAAAGPCSRSGETATALAGLVELSARFTCPRGELRQAFRFLGVLPANYRVVVDDDGVVHDAQGALMTVVLAETEAGWSWAGFSGGLARGIDRALLLDALGAIVALGLCAATWRRVLATLAVFAFSAAVASLVEGAPAWAHIVLFGSCVVLALRRADPWLLLAGVTGIGVGLQAGGRSAAVVAGLSLGSALVAMLVVPLASAAGRMLRRRGRLGLGLWVLTVVSAFSAGLRMVSSSNP